MNRRELLMAFALRERIPVADIEAELDIEQVKAAFANFSIEALKVAKSLDYVCKAMQKLKKLGDISTTEIRLRHEFAELAEASNAD